MSNREAMALPWELRRLGQPFEHQAADGLAVLQDERHFVAAHLL